MDHPSGFGLVALRICDLGAGIVVIKVSFSSYDVPAMTLMDWFLMVHINVQSLTRL